MSRITYPLPPAVYDELKRSALKHGGFGASDGTYGGIGYYNGSEPWSAHGHAWEIEKRCKNLGLPMLPMMESLKRAFATEQKSDMAVRSVNKSKWFGFGRFGDVRQRVSFKDWCDEMSIVRGGE